MGAAIRHARRHLKGWMRTRRVPTALHYLPASNRLMRQPLGVVGIVAPWNYPPQLSVTPAVAFDRGRQPGHDQAFGIDAALFRTAAAHRG